MLKLSLLVTLTMCTIEFTVSIFRCVVFNNRGIAGEELLVRMTSKINICHLQVVIMKSFVPICIVGFK